MLRKSKSIIFILACLLIVTSISHVYASSSQELKDQQNTIKGRMEETKSNMDEIDSKAKGVADEMMALDLEVDKAEKEIEKTEGELEELVKGIEQTSKELEIAEENLEEKKELFNQRIRVMYMNGETGYLEMLLASEDVQDFLSRKEMLQSIAEYDKDLLKYMKNQRDIIDGKKKELENQKEEQEKVKSRLVEEKEELEKASREKQVLMDKLENDKEALKKQFDKLDADSRAVEQKILQLQSTNTSYSGGAVSTGTSGGGVSGRMQWPSPSCSSVNSGFGYRMHPVLGINRLHTGIDIPASYGTTVVAAESGRVIKSGWEGSYGKTVMIDHGGGIVTLYAHNSNLSVSVGQTVERGQPIASVGTTGMSTGAHIHFEVRQNGRHVDPMNWLR